MGFSFFCSPTGFEGNTSCFMTAQLLWRSCSPMSCKSYFHEKHPKSHRTHCYVGTAPFFPSQQKIKLHLLDEEGNQIAMILCRRDTRLKPRLASSQTIGLALHSYLCFKASVQVYNFGGAKTGFFILARRRNNSAFSFHLLTEGVNH